MERYRIEKTIGEGAYGIVYKGYEKATKDPVAIKKFKFQDDDELSKRELQACSMLNHENIVTFRDSFRVDGRLHLVFDYISSNLFLLLEKFRKGLDPLRVRNIMYQICKAVHCCHSNQIIHRDIKPENILLDALDNIKLCDFGVARTIPYDGTPLTDYVATRWYRSPEQELRTTQYSFSSDIWSLGCILAELLTGRPLFPGETQLEQIKLIQNFLGPLPKHLAPKIQASIPRTEAISSLSVEFQGVSPDALDFLENTLILAENKRLTSLECINHPYFSKLREKDLIKLKEQRQKKTNEDDWDECIEENIEGISSPIHSSNSILHPKYKEEEEIHTKIVEDKHRVYKGIENQEDDCDIEEQIECDDYRRHKQYDSMKDRFSNVTNDELDQYEDDFEEIGESTMIT